MKALRNIMIVTIFSSTFTLAQNVTINPGGITPAMSGSYPKLSYEAILALPSPQEGDIAFDLSFHCLRLFNGTSWENLYQTNAETNPASLAIVTEGGTDDDQGISVDVDASGNIYVAGYFYDVVSFSGISKTSLGARDVFLAKYNKNGVMAWVQTIGGSDYDFVSGINVSATGMIYITGWFKATATFSSGVNRTSAGQEDIYICKYNSNGVFQWVQTAGGTSSDYAKSIKTDASDNIYISGFFNGSATFGSQVKNAVGGADTFIAKYNNLGAYQWCRQDGGTDHQYIKGMEIDASGNLYLIGEFYNVINIGGTTYNATAVNDLDIFIGKFNTTLQSWIWTTAGGGPQIDYGNCIALDASGNVYAAGIFNVSITLKSYYINSNGYYDIYVLKLDNIGNFLNLWNYGGTSMEQLLSICTDNTGNFYLTGTYNNQTQFDNFTKIGGTYNEIFVTKIKPNGVVAWLKSYGGRANDFGNGIVVDNLNNVYVTGAFSSIARFDNSTKTSNGSWDMFLLRIHE